jgi:hypothetical protein
VSGLIASEWFFRPAWFEFDAALAAVMDAYRSLHLYLRCSGYAWRLESEVSYHLTLDPFRAESRPIELGSTRCPRHAPRQMERPIRPKLSAAAGIGAIRAVSTISCSFAISRIRPAC